MKSGAVERRRSVRSWVVYDLANTIFALGVVGLYFPDWITSLDQSDSVLAFAEAIAGVLVIFIAPWAGARSDARGKKIPTLVVTTVVAVLGTAALGVTIPTSMIFLVVALVAFNIGGVVYDALLIEVSNETNRGRISGLGVGIGYVGSYIGLLIGVVTLDLLDLGYAATFRGLALGFLVFSLPAFFFIKESDKEPTKAPGILELPARLVASWRKAATYPDIVRFLISRFLYTDAINTLIGGFLTIFVIQELGLDRRFVTALLGVAITTAILGGLAGGRLVEVFGPNHVLRAVLVIWMIAIGFGIAAAATGQTWMAWAIGPLGGFALGATWAADRVVMTRVSPPLHIGEFYGLYATVGRFATILGPLTWALIVDGFGLGRRVAMAALILFVFAGWLLLRGVDDSIRQWSTEDQVKTPIRRDELPI